MKHTKLALSAVMIVAVGLIGTNFIADSEMAGQEKFGSFSGSNLIYGHITIVHSDPDGNILSYIQTDNAVSADGKDCLAELVFGEHGTTGCTAGDADNAIFTTIALYNGVSFSENMNTTIGDSKNVLTAGIITDAGLTIRNGGQLVTVTEAFTAVADGDGSKTNIAKTFTAGIDVAGVTINGATLLNNGTGVGGGPPTAVLAGQTFIPVTLNESDTLLITWTIELG